MGALEIPVDFETLIQASLEAAVARLTGPGCPPRLARAIAHAVLGGGGRLRPRLCLAVAHAAGVSDFDLPATAGTAIELIHCASLVHDDLPCFDDAPLRRGLPSVQRAFGEALAVLCGDALLLGAFDLLAEAAEREPLAGGRLVRLLARAAGTPAGMTAGQAWEGEPEVDWRRYHDAKTASLFEAAVMMGALTAGDDPERWRALGLAVGRAYQILDDLRDHLGAPEALGKPAGRDADLGRPNAVRALGLEEARALLKQACASARAAIPACPGHARLDSYLGDLFAKLRAS